MAKNYAKAKQHPETDFLINMFKTEVCLFQWDYMINCNGNENDNRKIDHINRPRGRHRDKYTKYI